MQTFLPLPDLSENVKVLDDYLLDRQVVETKQVFDILLGKRSTKDGNHPAVLMWRGYEEALLAYHAMCVREFERRSGDVVEAAQIDCKMPPWLGDPELHASHRSQLLGKALVKAKEFDDWDAFDWYNQFLWTEKPGVIPYKWPVVARLKELRLVPLSKQPSDMGCPKLVARLYPIWDLRTGATNFGMVDLRCFRAWETRDQLQAPSNTVDITRDDSGCWCWVVKLL